MGRPLPTVEVQIRGADGQTLDEGVEGEVHIRGPLVMKEYWRNPEATAQTILPGRWLRTGDIGRLEEGRLFLNSRKRDLVLRGGENVYPVEIDTAELGRFVADRLAHFKVPAHWEVRSEPLPRNAAGKVLKHVLTGDAENTFVEE